MNRLEKLLAVLQKKGWDAALIHRPENMRYLSGYTGEGCLFVCARESAIITDFRYVEQAERQAPGLSVLQTKAGLRERDRVREISDACAVRSMAVESDYLSYDVYEELRKNLPFVELERLSGEVEKLREVKDAQEIENIAKACDIAGRAFSNILERIHPGMREKQVQILLDYEMLTLGSEANAFDTIAAAGVNGSLPHAVPSDYIIREGDLLTLDFGAKVNGYCSDLTRTVAFGKVAPELRELYDRVYEAHMAALTAVRPGIPCSEVDAIARNLLEARYPGAFGHSLGHGVGLYIHELPVLAARSETVLAPGHVVTIEPGVYLPGLGGCRIEDTVIVTDDGHLDPVHAPKQFLEL